MDFSPRGSPKFLPLLRLVVLMHEDEFWKLELALCEKLLGIWGPGGGVSPAFSPPHCLPPPVTWGEDSARCPWSGPEPPFAGVLCACSWMGHV